MSTSPRWHQQGRISPPQKLHVGYDKIKNTPTYSKITSKGALVTHCQAGIDRVELPVHDIFVRDGAPVGGLPPLLPLLVGVPLVPEGGMRDVVPLRVTIHIIIQLIIQFIILVMIHVMTESTMQEMWLLCRCYAVA